MSRGDTETLLLKENIESQLKRLLTQLDDAEQLKDELDEEEYNNIKKETIDQLKEFELSLQNLISGNVSLVDQIGSIQLAIQSAIKSSASPEISNMFVKKEFGAMRSKLATIESEFRLGKISHELFLSQSFEIVQLLFKAKEPLTASETEIFQQCSKNMSGFQQVNDNLDTKFLQDAGRDINSTNK